MSRCRCDDIDKLNEKIRKLDRANYKKSSYCQNRQMTRDELGNLARRAADLTEAEKVMESYSDIIELRSSIDHSADRIYQKIDEKKNQLEDELQHLRHEDKDYHRHKKHDNK